MDGFGVRPPAPNSWLYKMYLELKDIAFVTMTVSVMAVLNDTSGGNEMIDNTLLNIVMVIVALILVGALRMKKDQHFNVPEGGYFTLFDLFSRDVLNAGIAFLAWREAVNGFCAKPVKVDYKWTYDCKGVWPGKFLFLELLCLSLVTRVMFAYAIFETCFRIYDLLF